MLFERLTGTTLNKKQEKDQNQFYKGSWPLDKQQNRIR